ncbi:hypothetical protein NE237_030930 [Protea cynaroides]|uniref:Uncharacterized protein n=1 Tax=Protea cynaroides TaxID=273540 RepID=A0A9Q0GWV8_9MAGN|nr:hypothetical protein NE237_030930 [Protea cynaroides]
MSILDCSALERINDADMHRDCIMQELTLESCGGSPSTAVENQAECNWEIEVDQVQHISSDGGAKANCSLKISKALNEGAAWGVWRGPNDYTDRATQQIQAYP